MMHATEDISGRDITAFILGAVAAIIAVRVMPPFMGRAAGTALNAIGRDPFARLIADHRYFVALLDDMEQTENDEVFRRTQLLLRLKRALTAHALAEEDIVYPALETTATEEDATEHLYAEHGQMKVHLYELDQMPKDAPEWRARVHALRQIIAAHAREEEEVEFPILRAALDRRGTRTLSGTMSRERAMVL